MLWLGLAVRVENFGFLIFPSESSRERVKFSYMIVECRVINHHPEHFSVNKSVHSYKFAKFS